MVTAALNSNLDKVQYKHDDIFNLDIPISCPGVPSEILDAANTWSDKNTYVMAAKRLAALFVKNFQKFGEVPREVLDAGPNIKT
jgi:phosphoenolpyruvate carboxykinase (ATP)